MAVIQLALASFLIAMFYYLWRDLHGFVQGRRQAVLRERVAYMLWVAAETKA